MSGPEQRRHHLVELALFLGLTLLFLSALTTAARRPHHASEPAIPRVLLDDAGAHAARNLDTLRIEGYSGIVIDVTPAGAARDEWPLALESARTAASRARLAIEYWIEVGRDPVAAAEHAEWLHRPHKSGFYGGHAVAITDWVCINNRAVFEYELKRVTRILESVPLDGVARVYLNDLLGAPEGCGCGNVMCRMWDGSIGEKIALGEGAGAFGGDPVAPLQFVEEVEHRFPGIEAIPVITEECEAGIHHAGVADPETTLGFGRMLCDYPDALESYPRLIRVLATRERITLLTLDRTFGRDRPEFGAPGEWIGAVLDRYARYDPDQELWTVIEGWELGRASVRGRLLIAQAHGARGAIVTAKRIDQSWGVVRVSEIAKDL